MPLKTDESIVRYPMNVVSIGSLKTKLTHVLSDITMADKHTHKSINRKTLAHDPFFNSLHAHAQTCLTAKYTKSVGPSVHPTIPRTVHQFWLGKAPLPELYQQCLAYNRRRLEPLGFIFKFYQDGDIDEILAKEELQHVLEAIPAANLACWKDLLLCAVLAQEGGYGLDVSMYAHALESIPLTTSLAVRYRHFLGDRGRESHSFALPCNFNFIGLAPGHAAAGYILSKIKSFWLEDDSHRLVESYTTRAFPHRDHKHGWMCQYYINEAVCHAIDQKPKLIDAASRSVDVSWDRYVIDLDCVQTAYVIKHLATGRFDRAQFVGFAKRHD